MANFRPGLSFIEIMLVLALLAVVGLMVVPNFLKRAPLAQRKAFIGTLNTVARQAWVQSLETGQAYKIIFNLAQRTIEMEKKTTKIDHDGNPVFEKVFIDGVPPKYRWPEHLEIKQFFIEGVDEIAQHSASSAMEDVWFFVIPEGMAQEVIINLIDIKDTHYVFDGQEISLVLNPFRVQFDVYEEFQNIASV